MARPSTKPVSGMRDQLPDAALRRREAVRRIEGAFALHGFRPLETPAMERLDTLLGKYGDEGDQLIYRVLHRGERLRRALGRESVGQEDLAELGLRYDLTVPLARVVAEYRESLPTVFRRFQIQPVWRADRAQKGRFREFTQCDADIVGSASLLADAEVVTVLDAALRALGFTGFTILLNHREVLRGLIAAAGIAPEREGATLVALDKLGKAGRDGVAEMLSGIEGVGPDRARRLLDLMPEGGGNRERIARLGATLEPGPARRAADDLIELADMLEAAPLRFDPSLARGLSYYTGPIFEVVARGGAGSLAGGGRYDGLVGMFSGRDVPATGFALGMERILMLLDAPAADAATRAMLCRTPEVPDPDLLRVARELRGLGVQVEVQVDRIKLGKQLARASAAGFGAALILGPEELERGEVTVRNLATREQARTPLAGVAAALSPGA